MKTTLVTLLALSSSPELSFMKVHDCMIENAILINKNIHPNQIFLIFFIMKTIVYNVIYMIQV